MTIDPYADVGSCRTDMQENIFAIPRSIDRKCTLVLTDMVPIGRDERGIVVVMSPPRITDI